MTVEIRQFSDFENSSQGLIFGFIDIERKHGTLVDSRIYDVKAMLLRAEGSPMNIKLLRKPRRYCAKQWAMTEETIESKLPCYSRNIIP